MTRALIVEDDPRIMESIVDVVESLGHEHATASCQDDARQLLNGQPYSYALLDLEIPVKQGRNFPRIENGINLLRELVNQYGKQTPVIVMTAHGNDGPHQGVDCMKMGAADYIPKPFPIRGRTLDKAILEALENSGQAGVKVSKGKRPSGPPRPFEGGRLSLFKRRVEICGVDVPISQSMHKMLKLLSEKRSSGKYAAYSGADLMEVLESDCGQNGIASQVLEFRNKLTQRLLEEANISCGRTDVINSGGPGYRLQDWITVEVGTRAGAIVGAGASTGPKSDSAVADDSQGDQHAPAIDGLNERQSWVVSQLKQGVRLQIRHVMDRFECSSTTAKRDLTALKTAGLVRFTGSARAGHYQLTSAGTKQCLRQPK
ncbi:response regulator [bacterium]|nr:response regulator [bacterium]